MNERISLKYDYSPKKVKNICKYILVKNNTLETVRKRLGEILEEKKEVVPFLVHRKGESHKSSKVRKTKLPAGFFPSIKSNRAWIRTLDHYIEKSRKNKNKQIVRYYFHVTDRYSGKKRFRISRKNPPAIIRRHTITIFIELT